MNWKKNIAIFMVGQGISLFGSMLVSYAVLWHITLTSNSGIMMTMLTIAQTLPMFFISPFGGVWADRYNKKHLINIADATIAIVTLIMAIIFSIGYEYILLLLVCTIMRSFGQGIQMPAGSALIPEIVPTEKLTKINGMNTTLQSLTMFLSPMAAGLLYSLFPVVTILYIDVITAVIGIILLYFFVKTKPVEKKDKKEIKVTYFHDLKEGLTYTKNHTLVKKFLIMSAFYNIMITPVAVLTPLQVARDFGSDVKLLTIIELAFFVGTLLGGLLIGVLGGFKNKSHTMAFATLISGIGIITLGLLNNFWLYAISMAISGSLMSMFNAPMMAVLQTNVEANYMGRVFSMLTMVSSVAMPLGILFWGPLSDKVAIDWLLIGTGFIIFLLGFVFIYDKTMIKAGSVDTTTSENN